MSGFAEIGIAATKLSPARCADEKRAERKSVVKNAGVSDVEGGRSELPSGVLARSADRIES